MMKSIYKILFFVLAGLTTSTAVRADYHEQMKFLIYSPRYFGPSGFPIPELRDGNAGRRIEAEIRGEYHYYRGDKTQDIFARLRIPIVKGRAGIEVSWVFWEKYKTTEETKKERFAVDTHSPIKYHGDIVFSSFFQVLKSEKWVDATLSATIKTASGGRACDARFTDAAAYWFDVTVGRNLWKRADGQASIRMQALAGFYCWMTNDIVNRQNDAVLYGVGIAGTYRNFKLTTDFSGIHGYKNNGDRPIHWRSNLTYEIKKNIISFRYTHGIKDRLYDSYGLAYIRCF